MPIYLDNHATTPGGSAGCSTPCCRTSATTRQRGQPQPLLRLEAEEAVEKARKQIRRPDWARNPKEIIFTAAPPSPTTWRSREWPRCMPKRQPHHHGGYRTQSSARHLQSGWKSTAAGSPTCQCNRTAWLTSTCCVRRSPTRRNPDHHLYANNEIGVIQNVRRSPHHQGKRRSVHTDGVQAAARSR